mgnify:CR=1 FL=1
MLEKNEKVFSTESISDLSFDRMTWMTTKEAAQYLRKTEAAFRAMLHKGYIRPRKFHRRLYFKRLELDRAIETGGSMGIG